MRPALAVAALVALAGCAQAASKPQTASRGTPRAERDSEGQAVMTKKPDAPAVEVVFAAKQPARPPMVNVLVDVTLRNAEKEPRWFVLPTRAPANPDEAGGGVMGVETYEAAGDGRVVLGKFLGTGGFQAVLVPGGGEVTLSRLAISSWQTRPLASLSFDVIVAEDVSVGGEPIAAWFGETAPASDVRARVDASKAEPAGQRMTPDHGELPVTFTGERRLPITLSLPPK